MTLWEWRACAAGVHRFHNGDDVATPPAPEALDEAVLAFHRSNPWMQ